MDWTTPGEVWLACAFVAFCAVGFMVVIAGVIRFELGLRLCDEDSIGGGEQECKGTDVGGV